MLVYGSEQYRASRVTHIHYIFRVTHIDTATSAKSAGLELDINKTEWEDPGTFTESNSSRRIQNHYPALLRIILMRILNAKA